MDDDEIKSNAEDRMRRLEAALTNVIGLFDPYGRGRVQEPESHCADTLARARDVLEGE